jgi:NSS family neurotransmitter:Na+ symporter
MFTLLTTAGVDTLVGFWPTVGVAVAVVATAALGLRRRRPTV